MSPPIVKKAEIKPNAYVPPGPIGNTQGLIVPKTHANAAAAPAPVIKPAEEEEGWWKRWGSDVTHGVLDVVGLVPVFGEVADLANAGIYTAEGDYVNAGISVAAMVPGLGMAATGAKVGTKVAGAAAEGAVKVAAREGTEEVAEAAAEKVAKEAEEVVPKKSNKNDGGGDDGPGKPKPYSRNLSERRKALLRDAKDPNSGLTPEQREFIIKNDGNRVPPGMEVSHEVPLYTAKTPEGKAALDVADNMRTMPKPDHRARHKVCGDQYHDFPR